ncbi:MAG TPA: hypothetical protein DCK87_09240, partial [Desulfotomaculum sp.]|nr:hypothetical protein [Desulfotomaculum sp.]
MPQEKEPKGITRRQFLKGATALGASALLSSCGFKGEPAGEQPTKIPSPTETIPPAKAPTQESSPIPEPTSTPEIVSIPGIILTEEYLKNAFAGIGGEEVITNGQEEVSVVQFGQEYVSQSWGEEINFANLPQSPINSLKYLVSLGVYQGQEGVYFPGKQGEEVVFPQLKDLSFPTLTLEKVPFEGEQREQEHPEWIFPQGLVLRPDTQMTVVGLLNDPKPEGEITVDKGAPGGEPNSVLVAFTDYLRADENNIPRHYLAILPLHFPADPENKNTLSLQNFLKANGYQYDSQTKEITFIDPQTEKQTRVGLNLIEEDFIKDLRQETGLAFVDQMKGELIRNPVVPYPDQMPAVWELSKQEDEKGNISFLLQEENDQGELVPYARAFYDEEKEGWKWQKILSAEEKLAQVPQIEGLKALWQEEKIIYQAEANNPYGLEEGEYAGEFVPNV